MRIAGSLLAFGSVALLTAAALPTGSHLLRTAYHSEATAPAWEYRSVELTRDNGVWYLEVDEKTVAKVEILSGAPRPSVLAAARSLGAEGWELVNAVGMENETTLWFKRARMAQ